MPADVPTILATSGGYRRPEQGDLAFAGLVHHAVELSGTTTRPRICLLGTASGDPRPFNAAFSEAGARAGFDTTHLNLFPMPSVDDIEGHLLEQDVVWVNGGSVANLLAVWRVHELDAIFRRVWEAGVVLGGVSAGSVCWYRGGTTDSFGPELRPVTNGLALLPYDNGVHYDTEARRRPTVHALVADGTLGEIVGLTGTNNGKLPAGREWFTDVELAGGGSLVDHTVHLAEILDSVLGAIAAVAVGAGLVWLVAGAIVGTLPSPAPQSVTGSRVLQGIDRTMPASADRVLGGVYEALDVNGFPRVFTGVQPEAIRPVDPPDPGVTEGRGIESAASSVVKVTGRADCGHGQSGSGWVAAPQRVVTNAHVVAGVDNPSIQVGGTGRSYAATTVAFDPESDVAVLAVPDLQAEPLPTGEDQSHGDAVVVAGFPLGGPYDLESGRVRDRIEARGASIDGRPGVTRDVYSVNADVEQGNSGGPLLSPTGQVVGTVFAKSPTDERTGYVLTLEETRPVVEAGLRAGAAVDTGECVA